MENYEMDDDDLSMVEPDSNEYNFKIISRQVKDNENETQMYYGGQGRFSLWKNYSNGLYLLEIKTSSEVFDREAGSFEISENSNMIILSKQYSLNKKEKYYRYEKVSGKTILRIKDDETLLLKERGQEWELEHVSMYGM